MKAHPVSASLASRARAAIEAAEHAGVIPTDRAEWMAAAAQDIVDGRIPAAPTPEGVRATIASRANELICVGPDVGEGEIPPF